MIGVGLLSTAIAVTTARSVRGGPWARWPAAVLAFVVPVAVASLLLPTVDERCVLRQPNGPNGPAGDPLEALYRLEIDHLVEAAVAEVKRLAALEVPPGLLLPP